MKKLILSLGSAVAVIAPIASIVSCGMSDFTKGADADGTGTFSAIVDSKKEAFETAMSKYVTNLDPTLVSSITTATDFAYKDSTIDSATQITEAKAIRVTFNSEVPITIGGVEYSDVKSITLVKTESEYKLLLQAFVNASSTIDPSNPIVTAINTVFV